MAAVSRRPRRRPAAIALTPLIDVVFILLVFFMLASRLTAERSLDLRASAGGGAVAGAVLVEVRAADFRFAGEPVDAAGLAARLGPLLAADPARPVFLRPAAEASVQRTVDALDLLAGLGARGVALSGSAP
jgi:biopolymer transport protein ExbD